MSQTARPVAPPRAAAVAGVAFSLLMGTSLVIIRLAAPNAQAEATGLLAGPVRRNALRFAIQLAPVAEIVFLWCIGVLRKRLGAQEDQFFAIVFFGSGLVFV